MGHESLRVTPKCSRCKDKMDENRGALLPLLPGILWDQRLSPPLQTHYISPHQHASLKIRFSLFFQYRSVSVNKYFISREEKLLLSERKRAVKNIDEVKSRQCKIPGSRCLSGEERIARKSLYERCQGSRARLQDFLYGINLIPSKYITDIADTDADIF